MHLEVEPRQALEALARHIDRQRGLLLAGDDDRAALRTRAEEAEARAERAADEAQSVTAAARDFAHQLAEATIRAEAAETRAAELAADLRRWKRLAGVVLRSRTHWMTTPAAAGLLTYEPDPEKPVSPKA